MSPLSPMVLGSAALVSSQAIWAAAIDQTLALDQALIRYLVAVAVCWALLSVLTELAFKPSPTVRANGSGDAETAVLDVTKPNEQTAK